MPTSACSTHTSNLPHAQIHTQRDQSAYDEEVKAVRKQMETEAAAAEALADQLSALVVAAQEGCSGITIPENAALAGADVQVDWGLDEGSRVERRVDVALCEESLKEILKACWKIVQLESVGDDDSYDDGDGQAGTGTTNAEFEICEQVCPASFTARVIRWLETCTLPDCTTVIDATRCCSPECHNTVCCEHAQAQGHSGTTRNENVAGNELEAFSERYSVSTQALEGSSILLRVSIDLRRDFVVKLTTEWLPLAGSGKRLELLYSGSRDGMTPAAFRDACDGKGPTVVLIAGQSDGHPACVFDGYAGKSWERGPDSGDTKCVEARDSFMFTLINPFNDGIRQMPLNPNSEHARNALGCRSDLGPCFGYDTLSILPASKSPTATFGGDSYCCPQADDSFGDPLGRGAATFTGAECFVPLDIEIWSVC
jgi:hypothetical protein